MWNTGERSNESGLCFSLSCLNLYSKGRKNTHTHPQAALTPFPTVKYCVSLGSIFFLECPEDQKERIECDDEGEPKKDAEQQF